MARLVRMAQKSAAGGYTASIPQELLPWLETHATYKPDVLFPGAKKL
jgi:hypothetical protein